MKKIGGNITAVLQIKQVTGKNSIGEKIYDWVDISTMKGFLDLVSGESPFANYNAKIEESTHIFLVDYFNVNGVNQLWKWDPFEFANDIITSIPSSTGVINVYSDNCRFVCKNNIYEVMLIDNVMELNEHLEIYLKYVGGQYGSVQN